MIDWLDNLVDDRPNLLPSPRIKICEVYRVKCIPACMLEPETNEDDLCWVQINNML